MVPCGHVGLQESLRNKRVSDAIFVFLFVVFSDFVTCHIPDGFLSHRWLVGSYECRVVAVGVKCRAEDQILFVRLLHLLIVLNPMALARTRSTIEDLLESAHGKGVY